MLERTRVSVWDFLQQNILLVTVAVVSGALLAWPLVMSLVNGTNEVGVTDAVNLINRKDALLIDVRDPTEFAAGHIPHARNVPAADVAGRLN